MRRPLTILAAAALLWPVAAHAQQFTCSATGITGFVLSDGEWQPAVFDGSARGYAIAPLEQEVVFLGGREYTFGLERADDPNANMLCQHYPALGNAISARLYCGDLTWGFVFDFETLRYTSFYTPGFIDGDEATETPFIEIGFCTPQS